MIRGSQLGMLRSVSWGRAMLNGWKRVRSVLLSYFPHLPADATSSAARPASASNQELLEELRTQNMRFDAAINNMSQGLAMFDPQQRLVVCNRLYAELYGLTPDQVKPGTTIRQLLEYRHARGVFGKIDDFETFARDWLAQFGKASSRIQQLDDGRVIAIVRRPMPDGGIVSTTEDITERQKLSTLLDAAVTSGF